MQLQLVLIINVSKYISENNDFGDSITFADYMAGLESVDDEM